ncbi:glycosyltransferase family 2 protein [Persicobacter diffluens]|uniref:Glycosyl transferase n=1 Tax=Persicobacter diffluens TaxID=981 RepID=A0AAN4W1L2_9BACT|nr:glycosyl transferase [Persicobacter diffluens]
MKISIITVVYNAADLFELSWQSVKSQTFSDFEYVVVDGHSKDGLADRLPQMPHIDQWVSEPDQGIYDAMNKGLEMAKGEFVLFLNAGDTFASNTTLQEIFNSAPDAADVIYGETLMVNDAREVQGTRSALTSRQLPEDLTASSFLKGMVVSHQAFIPRRSLCPPYDLNYRHSADFDWCLKILKKSRLNYKVEAPIAHYLIGGHSANHVRESLKERYAIMQKEFGNWSTWRAHWVVAWRALRRKLTGQHNKW